MLSLQGGGHRVQLPGVRRRVQMSGWQQDESRQKVSRLVKERRPQLLTDHCTRTTEERYAADRNPSRGRRIKLPT